MGKTNAGVAKNIVDKSEKKYRIIDLVILSRKQKNNKRYITAISQEVNCFRERGNQKYI
jgi:hypothetical protein